MSNDKRKEGSINIELTEDMADGVYANLAVINHSISEFVMDFINIMPGAPKAKVKSRVVMTPHHAKRLLMALGENVAKYEQNFGEIKGVENTPVPLNFGPKGEA